ncbi:MAG: hypothetical protein ACRYG8_00030, partial [Janthinobacterium lividum]
MAKTSRHNPILLVALAIGGLLLPKPSVRSTMSGSAAEPAGGASKQSPKSGGKDAIELPPADRKAGADATTPTEIPPKGWWAVAKRAVAGFSDDRVMAEAASVTFYSLLALFPAIASLISLYGLFTD